MTNSRLEFLNKIYRIINIITICTSHILANTPFQNERCQYFDGCFIIMRQLKSQYPIKAVKTITYPILLINYYYLIFKSHNEESIAGEG
jgi:hypothetical protein